jgi:hypothetical protein
MGSIHDLRAVSKLAEEISHHTAVLDKDIISLPMTFLIPILKKTDLQAFLSLLQSETFSVSECF